MQPTDEQRAAIGAKVAWLRNARFWGSKKDAYTAANVNSATWDRIEAGLSVKDRSLVAVIKCLWPETGGDWRLLDLETVATAAEDLSVGPSAQDDSYVAAPGDRVEGGVGNDAVLRAIEQMRRDMQDMERRLSERMDGLEQPGS